MRSAALLLLVLLSGCYSLGPLVADVSPAGVSSECRAEPIVLDVPAPKTARGAR